MGRSHYYIGRYRAYHITLIFVLLCDFYVFFCDIIILQLNLMLLVIFIIFTKFNLFSLFKIFRLYKYSFVPFNFIYLSLCLLVISLSFLLPLFVLPYFHYLVIFLSSVEFTADYRRCRNFTYIKND